MNCVQLIGNTTADAELKSTANGDMMVNFTIAVPRRRGDAGADFIRCTAFGKTAELIANYVKKGNRIGVEGRIEVSKYTDKNGQTQYSTKVVVAHIDLLERKEQAQAADTPAPAPNFQTMDDDDIPF